MARKQENGKKKPFKIRRSVKAGLGFGFGLGLVFSLIFYRLLGLSGLAVGIPIGISLGLCAGVSIGDPLPTKEEKKDR